MQAGGKDIQLNDSTRIWLLIVSEVVKLTWEDAPKHSWTIFFQIEKHLTRIYMVMKYFFSVLKITTSNIHQNRLLADLFLFYFLEGVVN